MDRSYVDDPYARNQTAPLSARESFDTGHPARLQKKRSVKRVSTRPGPSSSDPLPGDVQTPHNALRSVATTPNSPAFQDNVRPRKNSIRDAVRRLFLKRQKQPEDVSLPQSRNDSPSVLKHKSHRSEYSTLPPPVELPEHSSPRFDTPSRNKQVASSRNTASADLPRVRSPNAVEFPKSRHLKPLALPTPFEDPKGTLRRRKTLPSLELDERDAAEISSLIASAGMQQVPLTVDDSRLGRKASDLGLAVTTNKSSKRRSRSAGDLQEALQAVPTRKRSEEIRFWRESLQPPVLRASGFSVHPEATAGASNPADDADLARGSIVASSVETQRRISTLLDPRASNQPLRPSMSLSGYGTEYSRELEDRIAKLESNLQAFQRSLKRLHADKGRRPGGVPWNDPSLRVPTEYERTASMLADDLRQPLATSEYRYGFETALRPSTAPGSRPRPPSPPPPPPPALPVHDPKVKPLPPNPTPLTPTNRNAANTKANAVQRSNFNNNNKIESQPSANTTASRDPVTYDSLYQMLDDERSARKRLETQLLDMRSEITDLQYQVQTQSQVQSQRSSYLFPGDVSLASARLRELLRDTDNSPHQSPSRPAALNTTAVVSRFSGSTRQESETEGPTPFGEEADDENEGQQNRDEPETPYESYQTPREQLTFPLPPTRPHRPDSGMF